MTKSSPCVFKSHSYNHGGRSKRKIVPQQAETDALNGCLCGLVIKPSSEGAILCKKKGCETQWVRGFMIPYLNLLTLIISTIYTVSLWSRHPNLGFAQPVLRLLKDEEGSAPDDDVILPYLDMCLITKLVSPPKLQEKKNRPWVFFLNPGAPLSLPRFHTQHKGT